MYSNGMTDRKFFKTVVKFTVLSEEPIPDGMSLENIAAQCMTGDWSMGNASQKETEINGKQAARELEKQGSDPGFFSLTDKGEDSE
jgi:hypothetical protein